MQAKLLLLLLLVIGALLHPVRGKEADDIEVYEPASREDAAQYLTGQALAGATAVKLRFAGKIRLSDAQEIAAPLINYRLVKACRYVILDNVNLDFTLTPVSCVRMVRHLYLPESFPLTPKEQAALDKAREVLNSLDLAAKSPRERALAIHDWIVAHCAYDKQGLRRSFRSFKDSEKYSPYDGKFLLLEHRGVCESYAQAYWLMLQMAGVPSCMISGTAKGGNHTWNLVYLDDHWAHVDATWDDPLPDVPGRTLHNFFDRTDKDMAATHRWDKSLFSSDHKVLRYDRAEDFIRFLSSRKLKRRQEFIIMLDQADERARFATAAPAAAAAAGLRVHLTTLPDPFFPGALRVRVQTSRK